MSMKIAELLKKKIEKSGISRYKISQDTGIDETTLHRLVHGMGGINTDTVDLLFDYFDLKVVSKKRKGK
ncbi:helix-turn-helix domain-containing protein [Candidatus Pacearchaeota archaeon]|nr:helix-turn-helix domain-containing protein [Candidatus Pacearchaeota archaeon]